MADAGVAAREVAAAAPCITHSGDASVPSERYAPECLSHEPAYVKSFPAIRSLLFAATLLVAWPANAAYLAALAFAEPSGDVAPDESIPVWLRLTMDPTSDPLELTLDATADPPFGVPLASYPAFVATPLGGRQGLAYQLVSLDSVFGITLNVTVSCRGTLAANCAPGAPYGFDFNRSGPDSVIFRPDETWPRVAVAPGESLDFLVGTFNPRGPVAPGTYTFFGAQLNLEFDARGSWLRQARDASGVPLVDASGQPVFEPSPVSVGAFGRLPLAETPCFSRLPATSCDATFTRTVVPLPAGVWLVCPAALALVTRARGRASPR